MARHPQFDEIVRLHGEGLRPSQIVERTGAKRNAVAGIVYRLRRPETSSPDDWERRLFEPWSRRKARLAKKRRSAS